MHPTAPSNSCGLPGLTRPALEVGERQGSVFISEELEQSCLLVRRVRTRLPADKQLINGGKLPEVATAPVIDGLALARPEILVEAKNVTVASIPASVFPSGQPTLSASASCGIQIPARGFARFLLRFN